MDEAPMRRIRTVLYDDQRFFATEIDLLHTPALQRLYELHQLGLTDRVFIDASHSRLHHVVGVVEQTDKMMHSIASNLGKSSKEDPLFYSGGPTAGFSKKRLANYTLKKIRAVRLMALLHDITHSPYGHTLEDEIELVPEKHDDPDRQADVFYRLVIQYFTWIERNQTKSPWGAKSRTRPNDNDFAGLLEWYLDCPDVNPPPQSDGFIDYLVARWKPLLESGKERPKTLRRIPVRSLREFAKDLGFAVRALFYLDVAHRDLKELEAGKGRIPKPKYPVEALLQKLLNAANVSLSNEDTFFPQRDVFLLDVLGNTICADLLDYARRDAAWAGLKLNYDADRISDNMTIVTAQVTTPMKVRQPNGQELDYPLPDACLRTCVSLFSHKLRTDVPGELMSLLQVRYFVYERVLYHPTKCVAGAMLGAALQLIGWKKMPTNLRHVGDNVFVYEVTEAAKLVREMLSGLPATTKFDSDLTRKLEEQIEHLPIGGIAESAAQLVRDRLRTVDEIRKELKTSGRLRQHKTIAQGADNFLKKIPGDRLIENVINELEKSKPTEKSEQALVLDWLSSHEPTIHNVTDEIRAGLRILDRLAARRYFKTTFRLLPNANVAGGVSEIKASAVAEMFKEARPRKIAEREIERRAGLPLGSVVIHCPPVKGPTKVAKILITNADVSGNKNRKVARLNQIGDIDRDVFLDHQNGVSALEKMYQSTWRFAVSVAPPFDAEWATINVVIGTVLRELLTTAGNTPLENDGYTVLELQELESRIAQIETEEAEQKDGERDGLPMRLGERMLKIPQFSSLSVTAEDEEIDRLLKPLLRDSRSFSPTSDRQMTDAELAKLMSEYLSFTRLGNLEDPKLKALLRRAQRLGEIGVKTFRREMDPHRSTAPITENELKKQSNKSFLKNLGDAITKAEEAQEKPEAE